MVTYTLTEKQLKQLISKAQQEAWSYSCEGYNNEYGADKNMFSAGTIGKKDIYRYLRGIRKVDGMPYATTTK